MAHVRSSFLFKLNDISLYVYTTFHVFIHPSKDTGLLPSQAIVHSAAVSLGAELSVLQYLCLTFQEPPNFSTEAELFYIPTSSNMGELQFSHVFANTHFLVLLT